MNISCPHCSQTLELTPEVHASLQGQPHFACPACQGLMTVPPPLASAPNQAPRRSAHVHTAAIQAQHGLNRNLLVLGAVALLALGGLAAFVASRNGGNIFNTWQNITNQIIHNSYFTQLISTGVTTEKDLKAIAEIRHYGDGFIGVSKEQLTWEQAHDFAKSTGAEVLAVDNGFAGSRQELLAWLETTLSAQLSSPVWLREKGEASILTGTEVLASKEMDRQRKVLLHWQPTTQGDAALAAATKERPFLNTLGMKFVPVPGTQVLFCIHETRRQDYAAYATAVPGVDDSWKAAEKDGVPVANDNDHPVICVNWEDARAFCAWLSKKEGKTYRLPTDEEWSYAVGIGSKEERTKGNTPAMLNDKVADEFPWGKNFPPKIEYLAGNYGDTAWHKQFPQHPWIEGYSDGHATTAPVMSFKPNLFGLYDLGGNVFEWNEDLFDLTKGERVLRGGSWNLYGRDALLSSHRHSRPPDFRTIGNGFRIVLEAPGNNAPTASRPDPDRERAIELITRLGGTCKLVATSPLDPKPVVKVRLSGRAVERVKVMKRAASPPPSSPSPVG